jgi:hypothetical protein
MHFVKDVKYLSEYKLLLTFEDDSLRQVDLAAPRWRSVRAAEGHEQLQSVYLHADLDTIVWQNGADMSPGFPL